MSNKNYNSTLQTNNSSLEDIITQLNNLPNAPTSVTQATPTITVNSSTGLITATATQTAGYVAAGTKSATKQLAFQAAQTITPGTIDKTIPANTYLGGVQTIKGDANLVASNIVSGKSIFGVVGTATAGGGGGSGDTGAEDEIIGRTISGVYDNDRALTIGNHAFAYCVSLTSVSFPVCTNIGSSAFGYCSNLTSVSFPVCTNIGGSAFCNCSKRTSVSFPACTSIGNYAFWSCSNLTSVSFPACKSIGSYAFMYCSKLTSVSFPACTSIGSSAFRNCSNLTSVSFPVCTNIGNYAFCDCSNLASIYLGASTVCKLSNSNAFSNTSIWSTKGSIFVPASLLESYKAASNWSYFWNRIFSYAF